MNCPLETKENTDWLLEYSAGRLDRSRAALLERHVEGCAECASFVASQRNVLEALSQWEPRPVSRDFDQRLYRLIEQTKPVSWVDRVFRPILAFWLRPALPLAAGSLILVAGLLLQSPHLSLTPNDAQPPVEQAEPEQVERTLDDMQMLRELALTPATEESHSKSM